MNPAPGQVWSCDGLERRLVRVEGECVRYRDPDGALKFTTLGQWAKYAEHARVVGLEPVEGGRR